MAIYHCAAKVVSRGKGQSAIAKAAYNARDNLRDEATGEKKDYSRNADEVLYSAIFAPANAPAWATDRNSLWNAAEQAEVRKDAQLAREVEIALPHELTDQQREWLVKDFVKEAFTRQGMIADVNIHAPDKDGDGRNYHAHILLTTREITPEGFGQKVREWNSKDQLQDWRERLESLTNHHLERHGHEERVDHRTLEAQGIDRAPTEHKGPQIKEMEARGVASEVAQRREIEKATVANDNTPSPALRDLRAELAAVEKELAGLQPELAVSDKAQLRGTAADIRLAWSLTDSGAGFASALEDKGLTLACVSGDEARASERAHAFARAVGGYAPRYSEGELVVVNSFGGVYRLDERTTGTPSPEIEKYLGSIDVGKLLTVSDARDVMREAARAQFVNERQAERDAGRDITPMEKTINDLAAEAVNAGAFKAALYRDGLHLAVVDRAGIDGLQADQHAAFNADKITPAVPRLQEGELVVVNEFGGVHRLNPQKVDLDRLTEVAAGQWNVPALSDVRDGIAADRAADVAAYEKGNAVFWSEYQAAKEGRTAERIEAGDSYREDQRDREDEHAGDVAGSVADGVAGAADSMANAISKLAEFAVDLLIGGAPAQPTKPSDQIIAQRMATAALEHIAEMIRDERTPQPEDLKGLSPESLKELRDNADDYMRRVIDAMDSRAREERENDYGRARER